MLRWNQELTLPPSVPTEDELVKNNQLFLALASKLLEWVEPAKSRSPITYTSSGHSCS
jgi:hypothetical protein